MVETPEILKMVMNGALKRFEVFEGFFKYKPDNIDFMTRVDAQEVEDFSYLHSLHDYWTVQWNYESPIYNYLERKKRLLVSEKGGGRGEMKDVLKEQIQEQQNPKSNWDRLTGRNA